MASARRDPIDYPYMLPRIPAWVTSAHPETLEDVALLSGAALNHLHVVRGQGDVSEVLSDKDGRTVISA